METIAPTRFAENSGLIIVGLNRKYPSGKESEIPQLWYDFVPRIESIPHYVPGVTYGVCTSFDPQHGLEYLAGVQVISIGELPEGMEALHLPPRRYAVFTHHGHYSLLPQTFDAIWKQWGPESGNADPAAPSFERYNEEFNPETGMGGTEVWIPLTSDKVG
ncbi:MAG TPA: GyrI-like domain-containing protein [Planctomicrobium sp.]|nr:GyrI-like domain-containing protein [Planctomicrobium sp.]